MLVQRRLRSESVRNARNRCSDNSEIAVQISRNPHTAGGMVYIVYGMYHMVYGACQCWAREL